MSDTQHIPSVERLLINITDLNLVIYTLSLVNESFSHYAFCLYSYLTRRNKTSYVYVACMHELLLNW